jgi:hypothetical protein
VSRDATSTSRLAGIPHHAPLARAGARHLCALPLPAARREANTDLIHGANVAHGRARETR